MPYTYTNINQIDTETLDYLNFVLPEPVQDTPISEINRFLNTLESYYLGIDILEEA